MNTSQHAPLILASQSPFRRELLSRLGIEFTCHSPNIDESRLTGEPIAEMVLRLGIEKAKTIAQHQPSAWIIASDQSGAFNGQALGKPGNFDKALAQLTSMQGQEVVFYTSLVLHTPEQTLTHINETKVRFRQLSQAQLSRYLQLEEPYQCAGAFKSEGLGACLFEHIETQDPSAIIGLPLIRLANWLTDLEVLLTQRSRPND